MCVLRRTGGFARYVAKVKSSRKQKSPRLPKVDIPKASPATNHFIP
jgi:hypothetical protein